MMNLYVLDGTKPVMVSSYELWAKAFNEADSQVELTVIDGDVKISTVFLGLDHNFGGKGKPLLFETMIFGGDNGGFCSRTSTWEDAVKEHRKAVAMVT